MSLFDTYDFSYDEGADEAVGESDAATLLGDGNDLPVQTDVQPPVSDSWNLKDLLGSIGTTAKNLGTAVGTIRKDVKDAKGNYTKAQAAAYSGNSLGTWWQYASTTDKLMVGLGVAGILVVLLKK